MEVDRERYTPNDVGPSPPEWPAPRLQEVSSLITNGFVGTASPYYTDRSGVPYLYGSNVRPNKIDLRGVRYITRDFHEIQKGTSLKSGDILTVQSGHIGESAVVPDELEGSNCHALIVTRLHKEKVHPSFLSYYLNSEIGKARLRGLEVGSTILHINTKDLKKFRVLLPPLVEQRKIAKILSTWDEAIATTEKLLANSEQQKKALMQQLLTGKKRLPGFEGEWVLVSIGSVFKKTKRPVTWNDDHEYKLLSVRRRSGGVFLRGVLRGDEIKTKKMNVVRSRDFIISKMQVVHGASGFIEDKYDGYHVSDSYLILTPKSSGFISSLFFSWLAKQKLMYHKAYLCSYGVHIEKMTFNIDLYLKEKIEIPASINEQESIAKVLSQCDQQIEIIQSKLGMLKEEKKALMQQLLTGKRRVKVDEEQGIAAPA